MDFISINSILRHEKDLDQKGRILLYLFREANSDYEHDMIFNLAIENECYSEARIMNESRLTVANAIQINLNALPYQTEGNKPPHLTVGEGLY